MKTILALAFSLIACGGRSDQMDYQGEKIRLSRPYGDYDDYKNDPDNIHPSETARVPLVQGCLFARPSVEPELQPYLYEYLAPLFGEEALDREGRCERP